MLDIYENAIIKVSTNRIKNLESKITNFQEENKHFKCNVKALRESIKSQNKTYEKIKKDMMESKQKLETDYRNNEEVQNIIHQNTKMKEQIAKLEDMARRNNIRFVGIKEKSGAISETCKNERKSESDAKVKVFLQDKLGLKTKEITVERAHRIGKKEEGKRRTIIAMCLNYKPLEKVLNKYKELKLWEDHFFINEDFS